MQNRIIGKIIKISSFQTFDKILEINVGDVLEGYFYEWPTIGKGFIIFTTKDIYNYPSPILPVLTTEVLEIIDDRNFRTRNSIYKIVTLEDERDEKIKIILKS